jgi:hypothetical protein
LAEDVRFSPSEKRLLAILEKETEPMATTDLAPIFYKGRKGGLPEHAVSTIVSVSRALERKTKKNKSFRVKRSERAGPYPIKIWIEKK